MQNRLILGDNLQVLKTIPSESVDLCYIDPPFFSNRNYEVIWGDKSEMRSFEDRWSGGMEHYIGWLGERIKEIWRVLKANGNLCVHCDWHANAYIRVHILDKLDKLGMGQTRFINEIIWCYNVGGKGERRFARKHDLIFWYAKGGDYFFDGKSAGIKRETGEKSFGGKIGIDEEGRRYQDKLAKSSGKYYRYYLDAPKIPEDWWTDINSIQSQSSERIGYPTQKPLALTERIVKALSKEGDLVLDAFCGGGTTLLSAADNGRNFIGIDQSVRAIAVSRARLENDLFRPSFSVETPKYDYDSIRNAPPFGFERFIVEQYGGQPHARQVGDFGIDGLLREGDAVFPIQVKRSDNIGRNVIDNFKSAMTRFNRDCKRGYIIAFSFGRGTVEEAARLKREEDIDLELIRVDSIIPIAMPPRITLDFDFCDTGNKDDKRVSFTATGADIELWQWDWDYSAAKGFAPEVLRDSTGMQTHTFLTGSYEIAVRGTDADGISAIETLRLVVNGGVHRE
jgi:site-specific DNA-methyltransferase (adenine-specific)